MTQLATTFDYATLARDARLVVTQKTTEIRDRMGRAAQNIVEVTRYDGALSPCRIAYAERPSVPVAYWLVNPEDWSPLYVGMTTRFIQRMRAHCQIYGPSPCRAALGTRYLTKRKLEISAKYGAVPVAFVECESTAHAEAAEYHLITTFRKTILNTQKNKWEVRRA